MTNEDEIVRLRDEIARLRDIMNDDTRNGRNISRQRAILIEHSWALADLLIRRPTPPQGPGASTR